ncbi:MAG: DNA mismatch repair protein MutL [Bacteroidia bacterium]|nr:MAG: DNA mismatch repair protein MutL [Bacteroidia bacterium]
MTDIIQLLPDSVANQIAAGEVIQRPASVVKELVENAVDANSTAIKVNITDAGKTLIQIIDNGCGMSETDARLAFERHATSKIRKADDLFKLQSLGFRGEALASIAAVAQLELKTKRKTDELGTHLIIAGSEVKSQENTNCPQGSNFSVKNLFFNIPARRKFLKSDTYEWKHIVTEFQRIALTNCTIQFDLYHNNTQIYNLPKQTLKQRIVTLFGKKYAKALIDVNMQTSLIAINGFITKPEFAKKSPGEQFFFINNRYMKHPYFHKALMLAYEDILQENTIPPYFLKLKTAPESIDINIHPTKTEIKFENAPAIFQIIRATIKEAIGKHNLTPSIDFDTKDAIHIPMPNSNTEIKQPVIEVDPTYNPFKEEQKAYNRNKTHAEYREKSNFDNWDKLYFGFKNEKSPTDTERSFIEQIPVSEEKQSKLSLENKHDDSRNFIQIKNKYIITPVKSGIMVIHQKRAHERILYENYMHKLTQEHSSLQKTSQKKLYPVKFETSHAETLLLNEIREDLAFLGFEIGEFGKDTFVIHGIPAEFAEQNPETFLSELLNFYKRTQLDIKTEYQEKLALTMAKTSSIFVKKQMSHEEMRNLVDELFACKMPNYTQEGKTVFTIIADEDIDKKFIKN